MEETLAALRGNTVASASLPDLRETHQELLRAGEAAPRDALVYVETDRIVNSVNTLAEDVFRWAAPPDNSRSG